MLVWMRCLFARRKFGKSSLDLEKKEGFSPQKRLSDSDNFINPGGKVRILEVTHISFDSPFA